MCLQEVEYLVDNVRLLFLMMDGCFLRLVGIDVCIVYGHSHIEPFTAEIFLSQTNCHALFQCFCITFVSQSEYEAVPASRFEFSNPLYCEYRLVEFHPFPRLSFRLITYHSHSSPSHSSFSPSAVFQAAQYRSVSHRPLS